MKGLLILTAIISLQAQAASYSNIAESCIKNGINICYAGHPALNSKHKTPEKSTPEPAKPVPVITFKQSIVVTTQKRAQPDPIECPGLTWKLTENWREYATYRGTVTPGSVSRVYLELRDSKGVMAEGTGYPKPSGRWEIRLIGDYFIKAWHKEHFYCVK